MYFNQLERPAVPIRVLSLMIRFRSIRDLGLCRLPLAR